MKKQAYFAFLRSWLELALFW
jgi:hypothetical protein